VYRLVLVTSLAAYDVLSRALWLGVAAFSKDPVPPTPTFPCCGIAATAFTHTKLFCFLPSSFASSSSSSFPSSLPPPTPTPPPPPQQVDFFVEIGKRVAQLVLNTYTSVRTDDGLVYSWGRGVDSRYGTPKHGINDDTPDLCQELAGRHVVSIASSAMHMFALVKPKG
jgi:hypothetical protein